MPRLEERTLFRAGEGGYHTYRIPSLISSGAALLALCEGRRDGRGDSGAIDLVSRRSVDGGGSWSETRVLWSDGENTCGNPCPVLDRETGDVVLLMTHNPGCDREEEIIAETSTGSRTVWLCRSSDQGRSWSLPVDMTSELKPRGWTWYATGPGAGIQTRAGRLVVPCDHIEARTRRYCSHVVISDDHGRSWRRGGTVPSEEVNECGVVQAADGSLVLNMRNAGARRHRAVSRSADGGESWSAAREDPALPEPCCQAAIRSCAVGALASDRILFSNPADTSERRALTVRLSRDGAWSWPVSRVLYPGPAAYSALEVLPDGMIACLYERGEPGLPPYGEIRLALFDLAWLEEGTR